MAKTFGWMFIGMLVTFLTGYVIFMNPNMLLNVMSTTGLILIIIIEFALVLFFTAKITKMKPITAKISFLLYSFVNGLTFSGIFILYEMTSVMFVFLITAVLFAIMAAIGAFTKIDLTKLGAYLLMALFGIILCMIVNIFLNSPLLDLIISIIIVPVFIGLTAYDVQRIKRVIERNPFAEDNVAIFGAFELYLDYINIFLHLLNLFGNNNDN